MNSEQANKIPLDFILPKFGIYHVKKTSQFTKYFSPFREEKEPSFITNNKNKWHDFGSGDHGTLIDLIVLWKKCSVKEALVIINNTLGNSTVDSFSFHKQEFIEDSIIKIRNVRPYVKHKALLDYLEYRAINPLEIVKHDLKEVWYTKDTKLYFGIAFENDKGGYELRNRIYKNCIGKKAITTKLKGSNTINLFEGFMDYASFIILSTNNNIEDFLILNSTSMYEAAIPILKKYKKVVAYLDNDKSGKNCFRKIKKAVPMMIDNSHTFLPYKDLNEYLVALRKRQNSLEL